MSCITPTVGARVEGRYMASSIGKFGTKFYSATVQHIRSDGTFDLKYDDGDTECSVLAKYVRES
jgi:hypothetical protein